MNFNKKDKSLNLWVKNGIASLAIAGLYSIVLVVLRVPQLSQFFPDKSFFKTALVVHVNLSVLVWLLSGTAILWSMNKNKTGFEGVFAKVAFAGMVLMGISPMIGKSEPVMNNYIPMLENIVFILGLCLFGVSILLFAFQTLYVSYFSLLSDFKQKKFAYSMRMFNMTSSLMFILVWVCFCFSFFGLLKLSSIAELDIDFYYEILYWSGGHLLQFIYTQTLMFVWIILFEKFVEKGLKYYKIYYFLFILNFALSAGVFYGNIAYSVEDSSFKEFYTWHMKYTGGIAPSLIVFCLFFELMKNKIAVNKMPFIAATLISSIILFFMGGLIGVVISGVNVTIPAHYHGMIVGISVVLMGFTYTYCYSEDSLDSIDKKPIWQIYTFTFGQILHISGLALAGGYGVMRKNPGVEMAFSAKVYMGMVGGGGLVAILSGLMFVYICAKKLYVNTGNMGYMK